MSEDLLKKFYEKIIALLQSQSPDGTISPATLYKTMKQQNDKVPAMELLEKLDLKNIQRLIHLFQGKNIEELSVSNMPTDSTVLEFIQTSLPHLQKQIQDIPVYNLPSNTKEKIQKIQQQTALWSRLFQGIQENNVFTIIHTLIDAYVDQDEIGKKNIADALKKMGKPVVIALIHALHTKENPRYAELPSLLREMDEYALPALVVALHYPDEKVRCSACEVLKKWRSKEAIAALAEALEDPSWRVRKLVAEALGEIGTSDAIQALIPGIQDKHASVRLEVTRALGKLQMPETLEHLNKLLTDPSWEIRKEAVESMAKLGSVAADSLALALSNDNAVVRKMASRFLMDMGTSQTIPALRKAMQDNDISIREQTVIALGKILQAEEALIMIKTAMDDKAPLVRFAALQVLIYAKDQLGTKATLHILNRALKDPEQLIRHRANNTIRDLLNSNAS
ncbi:MAG: HEAT repeat domain-containing protein [Planctomycetes bacterium]|jgi:HEAT repeat protein|nr:HEAT repeat domain-containing protein [Planctomycetota bacterium]